MVRLKDIAEKAGVSIMTVSKALNNAPDISIKTKIKIRTIADQLGYVPDVLARGLRSKKTGLIGLIISASTNPYFARVVRGIEEKAYEQGYDLLLAHNHNKIEREEKIIRRFINRRVECLFISPVYRLEPVSALYDELLTRKIPTIILGHCAPFCSQFVSISTDDLYCSYLATKHLLELGHRKIAFFSGPSITPWSRERLEGYIQALKEFNIEPDEKLIFNSGSRIEDGFNTASQLINEKTKFTAIQAANDLIAVGAINYLLINNYKIPQQISVVGFGDILLSEHFKIPLTTINQPKYRIGVAAIDTMNAMIQGKNVSSQRIKGELIIRESTAPVS